MEFDRILSELKCEYEMKKVPLKKRISLINRLKSLLQSPFDYKNLLVFRDEILSTDLTNFQSEIIEPLQNHPINKIEDVIVVLMLIPPYLADSFHLKITNHFHFILKYYLAKKYDLPLPDASIAIKILALPFVKDLKINTDNLTVNEINLYNSVSGKLKLTKLQNNDVFLSILEEYPNEFSFFESELTKYEDIKKTFEKYLKTFTYKEIYLQIVSFLSREINHTNLFIIFVDFLVHIFNKVRKKEIDFTAIKKIQPVFLSRILFFLNESMKETFLRALNIPKFDFNNITLNENEFITELMFYSSMFYKKDLSNLLLEFDKLKIKRILKIIGRFYLIKNSNNVLIRKVVVKTYLDLKDDELINKCINNHKTFELINKKYFTDKIDYVKSLNYIFSHNTSEKFINNYLMNIQINRINEVRELIKNDKNIFIKLILNKKINLSDFIKNDDLFEFKNEIKYAFQMDPCLDYLILLLKIETDKNAYKLINNLKIPLLLKIRLIIKFIDLIDTEKSNYIHDLEELVFLEQSTMDEFINCCWRNNYKFNGFNMDNMLEEMERL